LGALEYFCSTCTKAKVVGWLGATDDARSGGAHAKRYRSQFSKTNSPLALQFEPGSEGFDTTGQSKLAQTLPGAICSGARLTLTRQPLSAEVSGLPAVPGPATRMVPTPSPCTETVPPNKAKKIAPFSALPLISKFGPPDTRQPTRASST
jgi:hypothetical protein